MTLAETAPLFAIAILLAVALINSLVVVILLWGA